MEGFIKIYNQYPYKFNFDHFFRAPVKLYQRFLNLKFRLKFNHGFTNHGYLHFGILKASPVF